MLKAEKTILNTILDRVLADECCTVTIWDGEENSVIKSRNRAVILRNIDATDHATLKIRHATEGLRGFFFLIFGNGNDGRDLICDHSDNDYINAIADAAIEAGEAA